MTNLLKSFIDARHFLSVAGLVILVTGCGGGGGNPGTSSGGSANTGTGTVVESKPPVLTGSLLDAGGNLTTSVSSAGLTTLNAKLTDPSGAPLAAQLITATVAGTAPAPVVFTEGSSALTDAKGVAAFKVSRASLGAVGAGTITLTFAYTVSANFTKYADGTPTPTKDALYTVSVPFQLAPSNITLSNLDVGASSLPAYGTRSISVQASIDGRPAGSTPIQVSFSANCGSVSSLATTNSNGIAVASYSAINAGVTNDQGCGGSTVSIVASAANANSLAGSISVELAAATNLLFKSATPSTIFLAESGGATQSVVTFKLLNASNAALQGQNVLLELKDLVPSGGTGVSKASFGSPGNVASLTRPTDANGEVSVPVFAGSVPTSVVVNATLVSNPAIKTSSRALTIASGRAVQSRTSLSSQFLSIEGLNIDGTSTDLTMRLADRQGNPVPDGTTVNFVTEGGVVIPPTCQTLNSQCSTKLFSGNPRPANGLVTVLAYAPGEEDFVDSNFDNAYQLGESFSDLGNAYRADSSVSGAVGAYVAGSFTVPRTGTQVTCSGGYLGRPDSCDGVWGAVDVRQQQVIVFASSQANFSAPAWVSAADSVYNSSPVVTTSLTFEVSDQNGNSMPTGTKIEVTATDNSPTLPTTGSGVVLIYSCSLIDFSPSSVQNTLNKIAVTANLRTCVSGDKVSVKVTSPGGFVTSTSFTVP